MEIADELRAGEREVPCVVDVVVVGCEDIRDVEVKAVAFYGELEAGGISAGLGAIFADDAVLGSGGGRDECGGGVWREDAEGW